MKTAYVVLFVLDVFFLVAGPTLAQQPQQAAHNDTSTAAPAPQKKDAPKPEAKKEEPAPELSPEKLAAILAVQVQAYKDTTKMNELQQKWNAYMLNDPEYKKVSRDNDDQNAKWLELINAAALKDKNGKEWILDPATYKYIPKPPQEKK
jgi:hypothetical protein